MEILSAPSQSCQVELEALRRRVASLEDELHCRQASEAALRENERNLWNFFNTIDDLLFILDNQGRILDANNTVYLRLGYTAEELAGQSVLLVHPPDRREEAGRIVADMLAGRCEACPIPLQTKDGRLIPVETRVRLGEWSGRPVIFGVTKDLSSLKASEEKFARAFAASPALMAITDLVTNQYIDVNATFLDTLGFTRDDVIGHTAAELNLFADPGQRALALQTLQARGQLRNFDVTVRAKSGEIHHGLFAAEIIQLQDRRVLLTVMNDITERKHLEAALLASEAQFRQMFVEHSAVRLLIDPASGAIVDANAAASRFYGYPIETLRQLNISQINTSPLMAIQHQLTAVWRGEQNYFVAQHRLASGEVRDVEVHSTPMEIHGRAVLYSVIHDITERAQTEAALRKSELKFRRVVEASADAIVLIDEQGLVIEWNRTAETLTGLSAAETLGQPYWDVQVRLYPDPPAPPGFTLGVQARIQAALRTGSGDFLNVPVEHALRRTTGEKRNVLQYIYPIKTETGYWLGSISRDMTERQQMEQALRASEEKFRRVVEEARDALSLMDEDGNIIEWNHSTEVLTGISRAEALGQPLWEIQWRLMRPERRSSVVYEYMQGAYLAALETGQAPFIDHPIIVEFQRSDGERRTVLQNCFPIKTARGYWLGNTSLDITDLKRTEVALNQLNAQLEQRVAERTRELIEANLRLTELDRLKDEFISRINHELRTPLTSIKAYVELLTYGKLEKHDKYIHIIAEQTDRLQTIIESLLEVPQLRVGDIDVNPEQVEINALVDGLCANRQSVASLRGVQLQACLADQLPPVMTDKTLVLRAMLNVVMNALNYTPKGGAVTLTTGSQAEGDRLWVTIAVADTGPGISEKDRPYIFEPFYRGEASNDYKTPGTGVGLFMARRLLETLGGKIVVDSQPGAGATFTLWLPDGTITPA